MQMPAGQEAFLSAPVVDLFLGLQQFALMQCMQPFFSKRVVEDATGVGVTSSSALHKAGDVEQRASVLRRLCDNVRALPQPQQDVLHAITLVFDPLLRKHECPTAQFVRAWLCTLLCRV